MPDNPQYLSYAPGDYGANYLYGAEYENNRNNGPFNSMDDHNVPCAVCHTLTTVLTIPARYECPSGWTREYYGYLMSSQHTRHRTTFECMDYNAESIPGSAVNTNGVLFYFNEATCNGLPCPPYNTEKEVTCAVCTK